MTVTLKFDAKTESGKTIPKGTVLEYIGHIVGGMISVVYEEQREVIHPATTEELS